MKKKTISIKNIKHPPLTILYAIALAEGGCVMMIELAGAKIMAPYYGSSLYVWSAILTVTLGGLAVGYFIGGKIAATYRPVEALKITLAATALFLLALPFVADYAMQAFSSWGVRRGALLSAISYLLIPLMCMAVISPLIIQLVSSHQIEPGKAAGTVYAVSTLGGIIMTLLTGFYLLPEHGIRITIFICVFFLSTLWIILAVVLHGQRMLAFLFWASILLIGMALLIRTPITSSGMPRIIYDREGILGQVRVYDYLESANKVMRLLLVNGIPQTHVTLQYMPVSAWPYPHRIATLASSAPTGSRALLIGLGGGSVAMELIQQGFSLDIVEIDKRMLFVAEKYFAFKPYHCRIMTDDGRHFLRNTSEKYAVIVIDVLNGEVPPYHLFTLEAFETIKKVLLPSGIMLINFQGTLTGKQGLPGRSIMKTLIQSGFLVQYFAQANEGIGDIIFIASQQPYNFHHIDLQRLNRCCQQIAFRYEDLITNQPVPLDDAIILTDDKPQLEMINAPWTEIWRHSRINDYAQYLFSKKIPLYQ